MHADAERDNWMSAQETLEYGFIDEIMANNKLGLNHPKWEEIRLERGWDKSPSLLNYL